MVRVRATERCYIDNRLREPGDEFNFRGPIPADGRPFEEILEGSAVDEEAAVEENIADPVVVPHTPRRRRTARPTEV